MGMLPSLCLCCPAALDKSGVLSACRATCFDAVEVIEYLISVKMAFLAMAILDMTKGMIASIRLFESGVGFYRFQ